MNIRTDFWMKPIPPRRFDWSAIDEDSYDGADDAGRSISATARRKKKRSPS